MSSPLAGNEICICIPTADRSDMLQNVLLQELSWYRRCSIDVIVYDSSEDDRTQKVCDFFRSSGFKNLTYKYMEPEKCLDCKLMCIFRDDTALQQYRYIWLMNDSIAILPEALKQVVSYTVVNKYDLIRLPSVGYGSADDCIFTDINEWFHHASRNMAHMATTLMSSRLLHGKIDWDYLQDKYIGTNDITKEGHGFFFTVGFYLERISTLNSFSGLLIGNKMRWWRESPLKQGKSYWQKFMLATWARSYCETIFSLPDCYTAKENVIRESDNIHCGRFGEQSLISLRIQGQFSMEDVVRYEKYWPLVSKVPIERIREIAMFPIEELKKKYGDHYGDLGQWKENLELIKRDLIDVPIIVYGAGLYGGNVVRELLHDGYEVLAVAVSDVSSNPLEIDGIPVKSISELSEVKDNAVVIIAAMLDTAHEIRKVLETYGFQRIRSLF